jgi:hypothetical protein
MWHSGTNATHRNLGWVGSWGFVLLDFVPCGLWKGQELWIGNKERGGECAVPERDCMRPSSHVRRCTILTVNHFLKRSVYMPPKLNF